MFIENLITQNGERDVTVLLHEINACAGTHTMRRFATKRKGEVKCKDSGLLFKKKKTIEEYAPIFFSYAIKGIETQFVRI